MTNERNDLSPWIHPKSKGWFKVLLRRTNLLIAIEDEMKRPDDQLNIHVVRMALSIAIMLGRPEIWPEEDRDILRIITNKAKKFAQLSPQAKSGKPISVSEHKAHSRLAGQILAECEIVRRRLGISVRKTEIEAPQSWDSFWE